MGVFPSTLFVASHAGDAPIHVRPLDFWIWSRQLITWVVPSGATPPAQGGFVGPPAPSMQVFAAVGLQLGVPPWHGTNSGGCVWLGAFEIVNVKSWGGF